MNAVAPGFIETPMKAFVLKTDPVSLRIWLGKVPMGRFGTAFEIATAVLFLASYAARRMTGAIVLADDGYTVW